MPALLQAFLRLVAPKRLGIFLFVLAATLCTANTASAFEHAQTKTRVWDFEPPGNNSSGLLTPATNGKHQGNRLAQSEIASDSLHIAEGVPQFVNPKFAAQPEQQLVKDGSKSVLKSLRSLEGRLAEHEAKLPSLQYKSSVEREIRAFKDQIETIKQFIEHHGLNR